MNLGVMGKFQTTSIFQNFVIIENFFCVNRSFLIENHLWFLSNFIFITVASITSTVIIYDLIYDESVSRGLRVLQIIVIIEIVHLVSTARSAKSFPSIAKLDEKCGDDEEYVSVLKEKASNAVVFLVIMTLLDLSGFAIMDVKPSVLIAFFIATGAADAEILFYTLLITSINLRLSKLKRLSASVGAKKYGYILIASANLSTDFSIRVSYYLNYYILLSI